MPSYSRGSTLTPCRSPTPPSIPVQPDHFYGSENVTFPPSPDSDGKTWLDPEDDPLAQRGIPVFKPTMDEFQDFEGYMNRVEVWGMKSGIVKVIPPKEWTESLPDLKKQLVDVKIKTPIEQHMMGSGGLFRQENMEKRKLMSVREWVELCSKDEFRAPAIQEVGLSSRKDNVPVRTRPPRKTKQKVDAASTTAGPSTIAVKDEPDDEEVAMPESVATPPHSDGTPPPTSKAPTAKSKGKKKKVVKVEPKPRPKRVGQTREAREASLAQRAARDRAFIDVFDPDDEWLPANTKASDYNEEFCQKLERHYWRNCGLGKPAWYGADTQGSLFTDEVTAWNVAHLPSALSRLLPQSAAGLPGVNTPYLYFGMWRATFAWHVEDMDLFSINYIHFGAPKFWYAVPQGKAAALESTMRGYFPKDTSNCHQFLRHKSFLASPTLLANSSCRPNHLVQKSGEFVITFPRGYHAGFNLGLNCAESVNFALDSWLEIGRRAKACECISDSVRIDVDQLLQDREEERLAALEEEKEQVVEKPAKRSPTKKSTAKEEINEEPPQQPKKTPRKRKPEAKAEPTVDELELPKLKKIKIKHSPSKPSTSAATLPTTISIPAASKPLPKLSVTLKLGPRPAEPEPFPCCLCISMDKEGLLRVYEPPTSRKDAVEAAGNPKVWMAHEYCAKIVPETWVDEKDTPQGKEKLVFGVDMVVKDRWNLKCSACTKNRPKCHGAPVQCTKGKCPKAFHVNCARDGHSMGIVLGDVREVEKEVVVLESPHASSPYTPGIINRMAIDSGSAAFLPGISPSALSSSMTNIAADGRLYKVIKKYEVQILCTQHNPAVAAQKKANKYDKIRTDLLALPALARIKIRVSAGVFEVTLVRVIEENGTVEVIWDQNSKREFKWGSVVFGSTDGPVLQKPTDIVPQPAGHNINSLVGYPSSLSAISPPTHTTSYAASSSTTPAPAPQTTAGATSGAPSMVPTLSHQYSPQVQLYPPPTGSYNHWTYAAQYGTQTYSYPRGGYYPPPPPAATSPATVTSSTTAATPTSTPTTATPHYRSYAYSQPYTQQYRGGQLNWQQPYQGPNTQMASSSSASPSVQASTSGSGSDSQPQLVPAPSQSYYRTHSQASSTPAPALTPAASQPAGSVSTSTPTPATLQAALSALPAALSTATATPTSNMSMMAPPASAEQDHSAAIRELAALSPQETARIAEILSGMPELRDAVNAAVMRAKQQMA